MSKHKYTNLICLIVIASAIVLTAVLMIFKAGQGDSEKESTMLYETKIFDTDVVHSINIIIDQSDWDSIQENASDKEYMKCDIVIDGKTFQNVAIRAKGNSSLSSVTSQNSQRYSFKVEFDHYTDGNTAWGLDKLSLNNIIQDPTYMKDYISYTLMRKMGADAPLCSYVDIKVNGEDFGLYLAVEGIEESFVQRNYGSDYGNLYKPETQEGFANIGNDKLNNGEDGKGMPDFSQFFGDGYDMPDFSNLYGYGVYGMPDFSQLMNGYNSVVQGYGGQNNQNQNQGNAFQGRGQMFGGGMGQSDSGSDVALKYIDDEISSYSNIFDQAILDATNQDKKRLIASIKQLNSGENLDEVLNLEEVLSYFVVHNFVDNYDSYTGNMLHNYYLYEKDGKISMIAWDYNLAFGGFGMGQNMGTQSESSEDQATTYVNYPIDTPVSGTTMEDRPLLNVLLSDDEYLMEYHEIFNNFITNYFENGYVDELIDSTSQLIAPYVEKDKTAFFTLDEFKKGVTALKQFCDLRAKSIRGQLEGTIPSTTDGQGGSDALIDASSINMDDLGSAFGGGGFGGGNFGRNNINNQNGQKDSSQNGVSTGENNDNNSSNKMPADYGNFPNSGYLPNMNGYFPYSGDIPSHFQPGFGDKTAISESSQSGSNAKSNLIIIVVSVLTLLCGLIWLKLYRRKRYK